jgi:hypothetical protein
MESEKWLALEENPYGAQSVMPPNSPQEQAPRAAFACTTLICCRAGVRSKGISSSLNE